MTDQVNQKQLSPEEKDKLKSELIDLAKNYNETKKHPSKWNRYLQLGEMLAGEYDYSTQEDKSK